MDPELSKMLEIRRSLSEVGGISPCVSPRFEVRPTPARRRQTWTPTTVRGDLDTSRPQRWSMGAYPPRLDEAAEEAAAAAEAGAAGGGRGGGTITAPSKPKCVSARVAAAMRALAPSEEVVERIPAWSADEDRQVSAMQISGAPPFRDGEEPSLTETIGSPRGTIDNNADGAGCIETTDAVLHCPAPCYHACGNGDGDGVGTGGTGDGDGENSGCAPGVGTEDVLGKNTATRGGCGELGERLMPVLLPRLPEVDRQCAQACRKSARSTEGDAGSAASLACEPHPDNSDEESWAVGPRHSAKGTEGLQRPGIRLRSSMESAGACHTPGPPPEPRATSLVPGATAAAGDGDWLLAPRSHAPMLSIACLVLAVLFVFLGQPTME